MKTNKILFAVLAAAAVSACQAEMLDEQVETSPAQKVTIVADMETDDAPSSKATIGLNAAGKPQTFWEDGDKITIYSSGNGDVNKVMYAFETSLSAPSASATFVYEGNDFVEGDNYLAIYPHTATSTRDANFASTRMAQVDVPASQTLVAGGFDRKAAVMLAYSDSKDNMKFMNAVALVKFQVADDNVKYGSINANGTAIAGRFRGDIILDENGTPCGTELATYSSGSTNAPTSTLNFSVEGDAALAKNTEYYVAVRPTALENGFTVSLNGEEVKTFYITEFKRNTVYNLGTLALPEKEEDELTLLFDFSTDGNFVSAGNGYSAWPTVDKWNAKSGEDIICGYNLNGIVYDFRLADCGGATNARIFWNANGYNGAKYLQISNAKRYVGVPAIKGYKLIHVSCLHGTKATTNGRGIAITSDIVDSDSTPTYVSGGTPHITKTTGEIISFNLEGTEANTVYYINCSLAGIGLRNIKLTYKKVDGDEDVPAFVRVGTYNLRYINTTESDQNNLWDNRKDRVIQSIKDNDFDIFAVQECSDGIRDYLETEVATTYAGQYFNPYSATGGDGAGKDEYIGILYKKNEFTLSDWHQFWMADDLASSESRPADRNDASGDNTYYRGGCCAVITQVETGEKMFVMATHGCLGAEYRAEYAPLFEAVEKKYNTAGYPSFFLGDMNARPTDDASVTYRQYWMDPYRELSGDKIRGPFATYNGFDLDRDLNLNNKRLDYVYYRNATPLNYVCNDKKYDGYYASDHLPVYSDFVITK